MLYELPGERINTGSDVYKLHHCLFLLFTQCRTTAKALAGCFCLCNSRMRAFKEKVALKLSDCRDYPHCDFSAVMVSPTPLNAIQWKRISDAANSLAVFVISIARMLVRRREQ